jgi:hypothetical protein
LHAGSPGSGPIREGALTLGTPNCAWQGTAAGRLSSLWPAGARRTVRLADTGWWLAACFR